jgi:hypothetical protein
MILPVRRCDPTYGITGPIYRFPNVQDDDDDDAAGARKGGVSNTLCPIDTTPTAAAAARVRIAKIWYQPTGQRRNRKQKNVAPSAMGGVLTMVWWIGVQILCVIGVVVYFVL